ncbi:MAG: SDR family NAD(P)-dependent oxidoreductase [Clostridia bacterium]|nr:SDR family NAD(P)-dependent oxidoreductase [Clostridia bacterium]
MSKVAIVTGASKGIGLSTARILKEAGYIVYGLSRSGKSCDGVKAVCCNVTDCARLEAVYAEIFEREGSIDLLVNNAGLGISGAVEFTTDEQVKKIIDLNLLSVEKSCRLALKYLRMSKGRIINLSSVAGLLPIPFQTYYTATKSAVLYFSRALDLEVRTYGVRVVAVLPGDTKTSFTDSRDKNTLGEEVYGDRIARSVARMEKDERGGVSPDKVAKVILKQAKIKSPKPYAIVGFDYKLLVLLSRILPQKLVDKILYKLYAK